MKFTTSEAKLISAVAGLPGEVHVHFEASELAGWVRSVLKGRVARIVVSHAKINAWIANDPLKCDRRDAFKLAELLRLGRVREVDRPLTSKPLPTLGCPAPRQDKSPMPDSAGKPSPRHKGMVRKVYRECPAKDKGRAEWRLTTR